MISYYSTFITGTQEVVEKALKDKLEDVEIELLLDGLVVYSTNKSLEQIKHLRFINNSYVLLKMFKQEGLEPRDLIRSILSKPKLIPDASRPFLKRIGSFRVVASKENQLVSVDKQMLRQIEDLLGKKLRLEIDRTLPDIEAWFLTRREGYGLVGLRVTKTPNYEKTLHKGELRPELAHIMCLLADLKPSDVVLDPFAGHGAIPLECSKSFKVKQVFAGEIDKKVFSTLRKKTENNKTKVVVGNWDALGLSSFAENSVDKIVTDPPWGFYDNSKRDLRVFYTAMFWEFVRVLKPNGLIVTLMAQKELLEDIISDSQSLELLHRYDILVSGRKSAIYKIKFTG